MLHYWSEPSLADVLSEPVVKAVMAADSVDPAALNALLREVACKVERDSRGLARERRIQRISAQA